MDLEIIKGLLEDLNRQTNQLIDLVRGAAGVWQHAYLA